MPTHSFLSLFNLDPLAITMIVLVGFISLIVGTFAARYLEGDKQYKRFFYLLSIESLSVMFMAAADNLFLLLSAWAISNLILIQLMIHKREWQAAANAGWLAAKTFLFGFLCLAAGITCLYLSTDKTSIQAILTDIDHIDAMTMTAAILITITAMTQSAIWPFHRWLLSSLNSPTPVSAVMHAGLVNGGGVLLARFAPLYYSQSHMLFAIFIIGIGTALVGSLWKLMQTDIKRMLACSTMAQMGFMLAQCGLGLFPAAVAHLCWHGLFKANLFLASNSAQKEKRLPAKQPPSIIQFLLAILCGIWGAYAFTLASSQNWLPHDSSLILIGIVGIAGSQFTLTMLDRLSLRQVLMAIFLISILAYLYGLSILAIESLLAPLNLAHPQPLNIFHILSLIVVFTLWAGVLFKNAFFHMPKLKNIWAVFYVSALNASQPHPSTITMNRNQYK